MYFKMFNYLGNNEFTESMVNYGTEPGVNEI